MRVIPVVVVKGDELDATAVGVNIHDGMRGVPGVKWEVVECRLFFKVASPSHTAQVGAQEVRFCLPIWGKKEDIVSLTTLLIKVNIDPDGGI